MKKSLLLIPLIMISCKKDPEVLETQNKDSVAVTEQSAPAEKVDSAALRKKDSIINNAPKTKEVLRKGVMRSTKDGQIIRTADAEQLPFVFPEAILLFPIISQTSPLSFTS
jgi:hypothetical protein